MSMKKILVVVEEKSIQELWMDLVQMEVGETYALLLAPTLEAAKGLFDDCGDIVAIVANVGRRLNNWEFVDWVVKERQFPVGNIVTSTSDPARFPSARLRGVRMLDKMPKGGNATFMAAVRKAINGESAFDPNDNRFLM